MLTHAGFAADIEPILTQTDAVAGLPLLLPVRVEGAGQPRSRVTLRFPDGRETEGEVAAVRFISRADDTSWIGAGADWEVLRPAQALRAPGELAWFVLAELPPGAVGQEIWLDGKPVRLRWLSRPAILGARLGFDPETPAGPLADPWASPIPESWRSRVDLARALEPASADPLRAWRATLARTGLHLDPEDRGGAVAITPDLLDRAVVEAAAAREELAERLVRTVRDQTAARWRVALARLWAADAALSLRVRHALAGAASFGSVLTPDQLGLHEGLDRVVAPVWSADDQRAGALLELLLDPALAATDRAARAQAWLEGLPDAAFWIVDDGVRRDDAPVTPTLGILSTASGDAGAIPMTRGAPARPLALRSREALFVRPPAAAFEGNAVTYRLRGEDRLVRPLGAVVPLRPPGFRTGLMRPDWTMAGLLAGGGEAGTAAAPSALVSAERSDADGTLRTRVLLRIPGGATEDRADGASSSSWTVRLWIGPFGRGRAVVSVEGSGRAEVQVLGAGEGDPVPLPTIERGVEGNDLVLEIVLPLEARERGQGAGEGDRSGPVHLGFEVVQARGQDGRSESGETRFAWPRPMLPWQVEPSRRVFDPDAWLGELGG